MPLKITFDTTPVLGSSGLIRIYNAASAGTPVDTIDISIAPTNQSKTIGGSSYHYYPVLLNGNTATIVSHLSALAYGTTYFVTIDSTSSGVFLDTNGAPMGGISATNGWRFTTRSSAPPSGTTNIVVAADGSGDFCTVQGAVDFVPSGNTTARTINIRSGIYQEIVYDNNRNNLTFVGQDRSSAVITYANNNALNNGTSLRPMVHISADDVTMTSLTLSNSTPQGGTQAEALRVDGLRFIFWNGNLYSLQDTILVNSSGDQAYFQDSLVAGNVDYIWGLGTVYLTNCEIRSISRGGSPNGYNCQPRTTSGNNGIAYVSCRLTVSDSSVQNQYMGRNNKNESSPYDQAVYLNCMISTNNYNPVGWYLDGTSSTANLRFWEYQSTDLTGTNLIDVSQRPAWSVQLNASQAASVRDLSQWFSGWVPRPQ
jgi:pectin methylesterase-like acyl-CoA thioesterase